MPGLNFDELSAEERLLAEQAVVNFRELNKACREAADGTVLEVCEKLALQKGRELIRNTIQTSLDLQAREVEKKGRRVGPARVDGAGVIGDASRGK